MNTLYPIFLKLEQMRLLIVGGGNVALEKLNSVLTNSPGTPIEIIAPHISVKIIEMAVEHPNIQYSERSIESSDIDHAQLIIVATDDRTVSEWVQSRAKAKGILVNVADTPDLCDFYLGSIVNKGELKIAISTNGKSPTVAKRLKEVLNNAIPDMSQLLTNLHRIRNNFPGSFSEKVKRLTEITSELSA